MTTDLSLEVNKNGGHQPNFPKRLKYQNVKIKLI